MPSSLSFFTDWLNSFINFEKAPHSSGFSIDTIRCYAEGFSHPQKAYRSVHIAGSKGKGSTAAMMAALLTQYGAATGLYVSPHVNDIRERLTLSGVFFSDAAYQRAFKTVKEGVEALRSKGTCPEPSWFELLTLTAFVLFAQEAVDWAVFETGMGGRLDATNCIEPELTLLTPIELEHCEYLGTKLEQIAYEKAGIIKAGIPVFCARQPAEALTVFKQTAQARHAPFFYIPDMLESLETQVSRSGLHVRMQFSPAHPVGGLFCEPLHTVLPLFTPVQAENAALAVCAFKYRFPDADTHLIEQALAAARLPARFQVLCEDPLIVIDGAHTVNSLSTCIETFMLLADKLPFVVFACAADKHADDLAPLFSGKTAGIYLTVPGTFKKSNLPAVEKAFSDAGVPDAGRMPVVRASPDFEAVLADAFTDSKETQTPLLITGSFYLAAEAQRIYSARFAQDEES